MAASIFAQNKMSGPSAPRLALAGMLGLAIAIGVGRFAFTPILPMMQSDHGVTLRMAGLLASVNYVGYFLGALSAIWLRLRIATIVRISLLGIVVLTAAMGLIHQSAAWLLLRGLAGILSAWVLVFASAFVLQQLTLLGRQQLGGVMFGGVGFGIALAGGSCLLFLHLGWSADRAWIAVGLLALVLTAACWPVYGNATQAPATAPAGASGAEPLALRAHLRVVICYGILGFGYIIPATFLPAMARRSIPDPAVFGWAWPLFGAAALISTLMAGRVSAQLANRHIWAMSHAVMALGVATPVLLPGMAGITIAAICVGGTFMVATMSGMQEARARAPEHASRLMAMMTAAFAVGQIIGPLLVSALADHANGVNLLLIAAALLLLGSAMALIGGHTGKSPTGKSHTGKSPTGNSR
jgi:predicted MFS family arabinose efflux permease